MNSLPLDAVCTTGVGASVLSTDRCHRQAPITHLGPGETELSTHPGVLPTPSSGRGGLGAPAPGGDGGRCLLLHLPATTQTAHVHLCLCIGSLVTGSGRQPWRERRQRRKEGVQGPQGRRTLTRYFPLAPRSVPSLSQVTMGLGFPNAVQVMVTLPPSLASMY